MAQKCKSCGAPLEFSPDAEQTKCAYCGSVNTYHGFNIGKLFRDFFAHKPQKTVVTKKQSPKAVVFWLILGFGLPGIILLFQFTTIFGNVSWTGECQFIDYNNDDVLDVVGYSRTFARWEILSIVDGKTGDLLEKRDVQEVGVRKTIYCLNEKYIITVDSNHELVFYENKGLATRFTFDLPGSIKEYKLQDNLLCLKLRDFTEEIILAIDIETGEEVSCINKGEFELPKTINYDDYYTDNEINIKYEAKYSYEEKTVVSASKNDKIIWEAKLNDIKLSSPKSFQYTPERIIIFGRKKTG
jgi:LSD1 subclass zinc finger protein